MKCDDMDIEPSIHSFVVKIWLEESAQESGRALWRGRIVHVASGNNRFFKSMEELVIFIRSYLGTIDRKGGWRLRIANWLKRQTART